MSIFYNPTTHSFEPPMLTPAMAESLVDPFEDPGFFDTPFCDISQLFANTAAPTAQQANAEKVLTPNGQRLRRFLAFCLAIDYTLSLRPADLPSLADIHYFVNLANSIFIHGPQSYRKPEFVRMGRFVMQEHNIPVLQGTTLSFAPEERDIDLERLVKDFCPDFAKAIEELGLSFAPTISALRLFVGSIASNKLPVSQIKWLFKTHGVKIVAEKLQYDRYNLFPKLFPDGERIVKYELEMAQVTYQMKWFQDPWGLSKAGKERLDLGREQERWWLWRKCGVFNRRCELERDVGRACKRAESWQKSGALRD